MRSFCIWIISAEMHSENQRVDHQFKKSLRSAEFKKELSKLFYTTWQKAQYLQHLGRSTLYITTEYECDVIRVNVEQTAGTRLTQPVQQFFSD